MTKFKVDVELRLEIEAPTKQEAEAKALGLTRLLQLNPVPPIGSGLAQDGVIVVSSSIKAG